MNTPRAPGSGSPSLIAQLRHIGSRYMIVFALVTSVIWGLVSVFAVYQMIHERARFFRVLVESNQETIVSGQWRSFFEGLERGTGRGFSHLRICWGESSTLECGPMPQASLLSSPIEVPLMNAGKALVWVRADISLLPALEFSAILLVGLIATGLAATGLMLRLKVDSDKAGAGLAGAVADAVTRGDAQGLQSLPAELRPLGEALVRSIVELRSSSEREAVAKAMWEVSTQVAHDIRSPLAALDVASRDIAQLPEERRILLRSAISRIHDIANDLLEKHRGASFSEPPGTAHLLSGLIAPVVTEKRLQFRSRGSVAIHDQLDAESYGLFAMVQAGEFKRVLSNLINNSVEALGNSAGEVKVGLTGRPGWIEVTVVDDGPGIPPEVLAKVGERGVSRGKPTGTGLGLYSARALCESHGGRLEIASGAGRGTKVALILPAAAPLNWFAAELVVPAGAAVVVLDDDPTIHGVWRSRFEGLRAERPERRIEMVTFSSIEPLKNWIAQNPEASRRALYLLDYELSGRQETGLSVGAELKLQDRMVLVTSRYEQPEVLAACGRLGVRMIPKALAGHVPLRVVDGAARSLDAVLIDDDPLTRRVWTVAAGRAGKNLRTYPSARAFYDEAREIARETPIYVDARLAGGERGEEESRKISDSGFERVYLATGTPASSFAAMPHLQGIVGKEPPWAEPGGPPESDA